VLAVGLFAQRLELGGAERVDDALEVLGGGEYVAS